MGKRLTEKELRERQVNKAVESIRKLEKRYGQSVLSTACNKYVILLRDKRNALQRKAQLERELKRLEGKIWNSQRKA